MIPGTVSSYVVAYVISSLVVVEGQRILSLNPFARSLTPVRMYQYQQMAWKYCPLYSSCPVCCNNWLNPRLTTGLTDFKITPVRDPMVPINVKAQVYTSPLNYYPMLRLNKNNLSHQPKEMVNHRLLSQLMSDINSHSPITKLTQPVTSNNLNKASESTVSYQKTSYVNVKTSSRGPVFVFNNTISGRRFNNIENISFKDIKNATNGMENNCNVSTTVAILNITTTNSVSNVNQNDYTTLANFFITSSNITIPNGLKSNQTRRDILFSMFRKTLDRVERKFLLTVFNKLSAISPENRKENGISFLQSGLFLHQLLMSLSITMDQNATQEIEEYLGLNMSEADKIEILHRTVSWLPKSNDDLKFRWASRLVLQRAAAGDALLRAAALALPMQLSWLDGNETAAHLTETLNSMVLSDSGGNMHDTFSEEELEAGVCAAALGTVYVRGTWRAAPTLLNDSMPFRDAPAAPQRSSRYFRLNDVMSYSYLHEWDAEAIEIPYAMPGLTLLILVPKEPQLRPLVERAAAAGLDAVLGVMHTMRVAVTLPLYTLRMTLLLPNKLQDMGMPSLLKNATDCPPVRLSHAVQRLMFWAEAGRNAFKDDGIEWDPRPELEIVVDRPYLFYVRWESITIMNGVFVL